MCRWHLLLKASPADQAAAARARLIEAMGADGYEPRARVPKAEWPEGERWCSGCQSFVPLFYVSGSRCRACNGEAAHERHVEKTYGISGEEYAALLRLQRGRCYVCRRKPKTKRLAVDHDHDTGAVRGLLCPGELGCNLGVLGSLGASVDGPLAAARRLVEYLEDPPYARLVRHEAQSAPEPLDVGAVAPLPDWMT